MERKLIFNVFCMLYCFIVTASGTFRPIGGFANQEANGHGHFGKQKRNGILNTKLIQFPSGAIPIAEEHRYRESGRKNILFGEHDGRTYVHDNSPKITFWGKDDAKYVMGMNDAIFKILAALYATGNVHLVGNKILFLRSVASNEHGEFPGFLIFTGKTHEKSNGIGDKHKKVYRENMKSGIGSSHAMKWNGFQPQNTKKLKMGIDYAKNFAGFGNDGHQKGLEENFYDRGFQGFVEENKNNVYRENSYSSGFQGLDHGNKHGNQIKFNYSGGFSDFSGQLNENLGFRKGRYHNVLNHQMNSKKHFGNNQFEILGNERNTKQNFNNVHFGRFREPGFRSTGEKIYQEKVKKPIFDTYDQETIKGDSVSYYPSGYSESNIESRNKKDQINGHAVDALMFGRMPMFQTFKNPSYSFKTNDNGYVPLPREIKRRLDDDGKSKLSDHVVTLKSDNQTMTVHSTAELSKQ